METKYSRRKILLIEDDIYMCELLTRGFLGADFEVEVAKTGAEGIEKFEKFSPDLVILDLLLPDEHGFEVLRKIRRKSGGPEVKVMVLSNLSETKDIDEATRLGVVEYLVKTNFSMEEIVDKIKKAMEG